MKKVLVLILLTLVMMPVFCEWRYETQSVKDDFGDEIRKDDYYINGYNNSKYTDKYIYMYFSGSDFYNGYIRFGEEGYKSETSGTAKISLKEENGNIVTYSSPYNIYSNGSYWACKISMKSDVVNKLVPVFARNKEVKMSVAYGNDKYNYGTIYCSDFCTNPLCIKKGHDFKLVSETKPTCDDEGKKISRCSVCSKEKTESNPKLNHIFKLVNDSRGLYRECELCHTQSNDVIGAKGPAGGYIFYDCDADNDTGNADGLISSECGWRFLEAAPEDLPDKYVWGSYNEKLRTGTRIGTGKLNTEKISATMRGADFILRTTAKGACVDYSVNGYDDWFLPSKDELNLMYLNLKKNGIGSFSSSFYWSSTESDYGHSWDVCNAWGQLFDGKGRQDLDVRGEKCSVRPCRAFLTF